MSGAIYKSLGVPTVINAAGKLTALGGSAQSEAVAAAQADAARAHVDLAALRATAGRRIAALTGAEAACVTPGAAAGVAIGVAAAIAGSDLARVQRLPASDGLPHCVLLQAGHAIDFGAPVVQMIRMAGGAPVVLGAANRVTEAELGAALGRRESLAALVFVQSHHCVQRGMLTLEQCVRHCRAAALPVLVDAAAETDLKRYVGLGADLAVYSGGKAVGGPTSGFIAGRADLIEACELQHRGIARTMKIGKEQIAGLLVALDRYAGGGEDERARCEAINRILIDSLQGIAGLAARLEPDGAGRAIERVALRARDRAFDLRALVRFLGEGDPSIRTRNHRLDEGYVLVDPRELTRAQGELVARRIRAFFEAG